MSSKLMVVGTTAVLVPGPPLGHNFNAIAVNFTGASIALTGSEDGTTYTPLVTVPAAGMIDIPALPKYVKAAAASVYIHA